MAMGHPGHHLLCILSTLCKYHPLWALRDPRHHPLRIIIYVAVIVRTENFSASWTQK